jgi:hypothetical protein
MDMTEVKRFEGELAAKDVKPLKFNPKEFKGLVLQAMQAKMDDQLMKMLAATPVFQGKARPARGNVHRAESLRKMAQVLRRQRSDNGDEVRQIQNSLYEGVVEVKRELEPEHLYAMRAPVVGDPVSMKVTYREVKVHAACAVGKLQLFMGAIPHGARRSFWEQHFPGMEDEDLRLVIHLNDKSQMTFEQIAQALEARAYDVSSGRY